MEEFQYESLLKLHTSISLNVKTEKQSSFGTSLQLDASGIQAGVTMGDPTLHSAPPHAILTYEAVKQQHDDGSLRGKVRAIFKAMSYARDMAVQHGIIIEGVTATTRTSLNNLIAQEASITYASIPLTKVGPTR